MLIGLLGSPASGKTTLAAALFSELKNQGHAVEFFPEYAREYIMKKRYRNKTSELTQVDQSVIYDEQRTIEENYKLMSPNSTTITDGSTLNSYFYGLESDISLKEELGRYDIVFFCRGIGKETVDDNRVHDLDFSKQMDTRIANELFGAIDGNEELKSKIHALWGTREQRLDMAINFFKDTYETNNK